MPWKGENDPYKVWLSEIMLQQTRVEQGMAYYNKFIKKYPTIKVLANAPLSEVMLAWQGLGYYSRCRNLHETAKIIVEKYNGKFPNTYEDILGLKGIGQYTAAAIASFAYNLPYAVLDGNVFRVLSRYFGEQSPIDTVEGKRIYQNLANQLLDKNNPAQYNQSIMDFGATVCKPKGALCEDCFLKESCYARLNNLVNELPVKSKKLKRISRHFHYLVILQKEYIYIQQRLQKDIWQNLHEFYLVETKKDEVSHVNFSEATFVYKSKQTLTHQDIFSYFYITNKGTKIAKKEKLMKIRIDELKNYAFPKTLLNFLKAFNML